MAPDNIQLESVGTASA